MDAPAHQDLRASIDMARAASPIVYLDTQDYSKFGLALEGRGEASDAELFSELQRLADAGAARFVCSMPVVSELLQYDRDLPHITECKARVMEALCRGWALPCPSEMIATEVAGVAVADGQIKGPPPLVEANSEYRWFPDIGDSLEEMRQRILSGVADKIAERAPNRKARRNLTKKAKSLDLGAAIAAGAPEITKKYGLPEAVANSSVGKFLRRQISSTEASRRLFSAIALPTTFVQAYFVGYGVDRSLPEWMGTFGRDVGQLLETFKAQIFQFPERTQEQRKFLQGLIREQRPQWSASFLTFANESMYLVGMTPEMVAKMRSNLGSVQRVETARIAGMLIGAYMSQVLGLMGSVAKIETSFGGDLIHALYLPYVDLWRGDRRFASLTARTLPEYAERIVGSRSDLPKAIDAWHSRARTTPEPASS